MMKEAKGTQDFRAFGLRSTLAFKLAKEIPQRFEGWSKLFGLFSTARQLSCKTHSSSSEPLCKKDVSLSIPHEMNLKLPDTLMQGCFATVLTRCISFAQDCIAKKLTHQSSSSTALGRI